jgi:hypothetical protein
MALLDQNFSPPAPNDESLQQEQLRAARLAMSLLLKGMRTIGMYRHNEAKFPSFLEPAHQALTSYLDRFGPLVLRVDITNFAFGNEALFDGDQPMPYKFFRDGIRQLIFRRGFTVDELVTLMLIALSDPARGEDISAQLWRANISNFEYIMVDGFTMDEVSQEEIQVDVEQVVDVLQNRLRTNSDDFIRFARVSEDDLEIKMDNVEQMRGLVITGSHVTPELKARLQKEIHEEESHRLFPKLLTAVFQVVESGVDDASLLDEMFAQLLDAMLIQEDLALIHQLVLKLKAMEQKSGLGSPPSILLRSFLSKMGGEQRLNSVAQILRVSRFKNPQDVTRYLQHLGPECAPALLDALELIELPENRLLLCDSLVPFAAADPTAFVERLALTVRPQTQRDMVYVLDRANHPEKVKIFRGLFTSSNLALKLDLMTILSRSRTGEVRKLLVELLEGPDQSLRTHAARLVVGFDTDRAFIDLMKVIRSDTFASRAPEERQAFFCALAETGLPSAMATFAQGLSERPGLFNKQKLLAEKRLMVAALGDAATIQASRMLQELSQDPDQPDELTSAARQQLSRIKKKNAATPEPEKAP